MNRKIMVEVTPQELEKIQAGKLNANDMTVAELLNQLVIKLGKPNKTYSDRDAATYCHRIVNEYECKINDEYSIRLEIMREI